MSWKALLNGDALPWLLSEDTPGARYLALRDLLECGPDDAKFRAAARAAHREGPVAAILAQMDEAGYWVRPGAGYGPKYRGTVRSVIALAQLGASIEEEDRIATHACI